MTRTFVWGHGLTSSMRKEDERRLFPWDLPEGWDFVRYDAAAPRSTVGSSGSAMSGS